MAGFDPDAMGKLVGEFVLKAIEKRVAPLEARLNAMTGKGLNFRGVHNQGERYAVGDIVTKAGSSFVATVELPSDPPAHADDRIGEGWALLARRGRDSKSEGRR